tara:strand:- start:4299 stop:5306 length:1008 start_codon:yes stop_codon:yes gene_type:complete
MKDFKVEDDVMDKFEVIKDPKRNKKNADKPLEKKQEQPKAKKAAAKPAPKKATPQPTPVKTSQKRVSKKTQPQPAKEKGLTYPDDIPEEFKDYDQESLSFWNLFAPILFVGEKAVYSIKYGIIDTGSISIETKPSTVMGDEPVYHLRARVKTSDYYSYLYELDDVADSYVTKKNFIPLKFSLIQRESSQDIDDLQLFDLEKLQSYSFYKRVTKEKTKKKKKTQPIPHYFQDPLSIMYFIRGLPMDKEQTFKIPVVNKGKVEMMTVTPKGKDKFKTKIGNIEAYRLDVSSTGEGKTIKGGNMTFWFDTEPSRMLVKFKAKIKIGSISGEIIEYDRP